MGIDAVAMTLLASDQLSIAADCQMRREKIMRILIGNALSEDLVSDFGRTLARWRGQRIIWFAKEDDVLILPDQPDTDFVAYVADLKGIDPSSLHFVVPSGGSEGMLRLTYDRITHPELFQKVLSIAGGRTIESVVSLWPDLAIATFASTIGAPQAMAGHDFFRQDGGALVNSKAVFRALAHGAGTPVAPGVVTAGRNAAEDAVCSFIEDGIPVLLKGEYFSSGYGNELLSPREDIRPLGARSLSVVHDRAGVQEVLAKKWDRLTQHGRHRLIVERYFPNCTSLFAEFRIDDSGVTLTGEGELVKDPLGVAEIMPPPGQPESVMSQLAGGGRLLCEALFTMGYRGMLSADAIVTPEDKVYFTEYNGRITSSTHIYEVIGKQVVGPRYPKERVLCERIRLPVTSFADAHNQLRATGLAYNADSGTGVILTSPFDPYTSNVGFCAVGADLPSAVAMCDKLESIVDTLAD